MKKAGASLAHLASSGTPPDRETACRISIGLDDTMGRFNEELFPYLAVGGTAIQFVYGANGRGKTHFLLSLEETAMLKGFVTARIACPAGKSPFRSLRATYEMIATSMLVPDLEGHEDFGHGITSVIKAKFSNASAGQSRDIVSRLKSSKHLSPDFRNLVLTYGLGIDDRSRTGKFEDSLEALLAGSQTHYVKISDLYRADKTIPKPLGKLGLRNAGNWLRSLLSVPAALGYPGVIVMFDETEQAVHGGGLTSTREQLANLRNLVDYCALGAFSGCLIVYSAAEEFLDVARDNLDALAQRIEPADMLGTLSISNFRSVWTNLEELTFPNTTEERFFEELGEKIVRLGVDAGLSTLRARELKTTISSRAQKFARSPSQGVVRKFVKEASNIVAMEVRKRG
jgi:hypothetical protein